MTAIAHLVMARTPRACTVLVLLVAVSPWPSSASAQGPLSSSPRVSAAAANAGGSVCGPPSAARATCAAVDAASVSPGVRAHTPMGGAGESAGGPARGP